MRGDLLQAWHRRFTESTSETLMRVGPAAIYACAIHFVSSREATELSGFAIDDRIAHFVEYFVFGVLIMLALTAFRTFEHRPALKAGLTIAFAFVFALTDEWHQSFIPGRDSSWKDVGFDVLGASAAALLIAWAARRMSLEANRAGVNAGTGA